MDILNHFFLTAPGWVWAPLILYLAIGGAWAFSKIEHLDPPPIYGDLALVSFGIFMVFGLFWPVALLIAVIRGVKRAA